MLPCRYFDGVSSRPRRAIVAIEGDGLHVIGDDVDRQVDAQGLSFSPATDLGPARVSFSSGGLCEFDDRNGAEALFARLGYRKPRVDRIASRTSHAVLITIAFVAVMAVLYQWGVPWAADEFIAFAPREWDASLGAKVLAAFDERRIFRPTRLPEARRDALLAHFRALRLPVEGSPAGPPGAARPQPVIVFRRFGAPNALALPGEIIVVTDEIVQLAGPDDEALMTVLAHEVGHLEHRDAMRQLAHSALTSMIAAWYFGDVSNAVAVVAGGIGTLSYSRDAEHRADLYALAAMKANGVSTRPAAELFRRLQAWEPPTRSPAKDDGDQASDAKAADRHDEAAKDKPSRRPRVEAPEYLSTHPATEDRIRLFETGEVATGEPSP